MWSITFSKGPQKRCVWTVSDWFIFLSSWGMGALGLPMQKRCLRWRDGLCGGSGLNDLLKEIIAPDSRRGPCGPGAPGRGPGVLLQEFGGCAYKENTTFKRHNDNGMVIIYWMIINIENAYICGFQSCRIFSPAILPRIFLIFHFLAMYCGSKSQLGMQIIE